MSSGSLKEQDTRLSSFNVNSVVALLQNPLRPSIRDLHLMTSLAMLRTT